MPTFKLFNPCLPCCISSSGTEVPCCFDASGLPNELCFKVNYYNQINLDQTFNPNDVGNCGSGGLCCFMGASFSIVKTASGTWSGSYTRGCCEEISVEWSCGSGHVDGFNTAYHHAPLRVTLGNETITFASGLIAGASCQLNTDQSYVQFYANYDGSGTSCNNNTNCKNNYMEFEITATGHIFGFPENTCNSFLKNCDLLPRTLNITFYNISGCAAIDGATIPLEFGGGWYDGGNSSQRRTWFGSGNLNNSPTRISFRCDDVLDGSSDQYGNILISGVYLYYFTDTLQGGISSHCPLMASGILKQCGIFFPCLPCAGLTNAACAGGCNGKYAEVGYFITE